MKRNKRVKDDGAVATRPAPKSAQTKIAKADTTDENFAAGLTRRQVAGMLGLSISAIRRMEGKSLHPRRVQGMMLFKADEVATMHNGGKPPRHEPLRSEGDVAAEIFRRFKHGQGLCQIVQELHLPPGRVRTLFREWSAPLGEEPEARDRFDEDGDLESWEKEMRQQMAEADELDRRDREERLVRWQTRPARIRQV